MARYKITKSLIESWYYTYDCREEYEDEAMESFLSTLRCEQVPMSEAMTNGLEFEALVTDIATGKLQPEWEGSGQTNPSSYGDGEEMGSFKYPKWYRGARELAEIVRGSQFQVRVHRPITVCGMDFEIHGVLDALREGVIFDIKFRSKSFGSLDLAGSYYGCSQHPFYFYLVPEARKFLYLVSDGTDIYIEQYTPEESRTAEEIISEFVDYLKAANLWDVYTEHWRI